MKIFNWVHRKFQHKNVDNYSVCPKKGELLLNDARKQETVTTENDSKALLENVTLVDVFYGILSIGTFGFDPLKQKEYSVNNNHEEMEDLEEEEETVEEYTVKDQDIRNDLNPLVVKRVKREFEKVVNGYDLDTCIIKPDQLITTVADVIPLLRSDDIEIVEKKRITLADLFSADAEDVVAGKSDPDEESQDSGEKPASSTKKKGLLFTKKLMTHKEEDSRPMKKLLGLVTKMLRKKIHPELEGKNPRKDGSFNNGRTIVNGRTIELISLLQGVVSQL